MTETSIGQQEAMKDTTQAAKFLAIHLLDPKNRERIHGAP